MVAKAWWQAPHDAVFECLMAPDQVMTFGRASGASIRIGHAPEYDRDVPRLWGEMHWSRGRLYVTNVSERWGFDLVSGPDVTPAFRTTVPPGGSASPAAPRFRIETQGPGTSYEINVLSAPRLHVQGHDAVLTEPPSFMPFALTEQQKRIGAAVVQPLVEGKGRRASYDQVSALAHYSRRHVREQIAAMDALFVIHQLVEVDGSSDALDRVALTVTRHPTLIV